MCSSDPGLLELSHVTQTTSCCCCHVTAQTYRGPEEPQGHIESLQRSPTTQWHSPEAFSVFSKCFPSLIWLPKHPWSGCYQIPPTITELESLPMMAAAWLGRGWNPYSAGSLVSPHSSVSQSQPMISFFPSLPFAIVSINALRAE